MEKRNILIIVVVLLAALAGVVYFRSTKPPLIDTNPFNCVGVGVAEETAKLLNNKGEVILIDKASDGEFADRKKHFLETLKKSKEITVVAQENMPQPVTSGEDSPRPRGIPADLVFGLLEKHPTASAVVSLAGAPLFSSEDIARLGGKGPKFVIFSKHSEVDILQPLMDQNIVQLVILSRTKPPTNEPTDLSELFKAYYRVYTPETPLPLP
jgi:hypothetical protein